MKKVCVVGVGRMGEIHAANVMQHPQLQLHSVLDPDLAKAQRIAQDYGIVALSDQNEVIHSQDVDAVIIASPKKTHQALVEQATQRGKAVLCESPLALSGQEAKECVEKVEKSLGCCMVAFNRRFDPAFEAVRQQILAGNVGEVVSLSIQSWKAGEKKGLRGACLHDFDLARWLLGEEIVEVRATESGGKENATVVCLKSVSGKEAELRVSDQLLQEGEPVLHVEGQRGKVSSHHYLRSPKRFQDFALKGRGDSFNQVVRRYYDSFRLLLEHFVRGMGAQGTFSSSLREGVQALLLAEAAERSLERGAVEVIQEGGRCSSLPQ